MFIPNFQDSPNGAYLQLLQENWDRNRKNYIETAAMYPERAKEAKLSELFALAENAMRFRDEKLLDGLLAEHQEFIPEDTTFIHHYKFQKACLQIYIGYHGMALKMFRELVEESEGDTRWEALEMVINLAYEMGIEEEAIPYIPLYFEANEQCGWGAAHKAYSFWLGMHLLSKYNEHETVLRYGKEKLAEKPDDATTLFQVGKAYLGLKDDLRAWHYFKQALDIQPRYPEIYFHLGVYNWEELGDIPTAVSYLLKAVEISPEDVEDKAMLANTYKYLYRAHAQIFDHEAAAAYLERQFEAMSYLHPVERLDFFDNDELFIQYIVWEKTHPEFFDKKEKGDEQDGTNQPL